MSVWCKVYLDKRSVIVSVLRRPPGSDPNLSSGLNAFLHEQNIFSSDMLLVGDFNAPDISWPSLTLTGHEVRSSRMLLELVQWTDLKQNNLLEVKLYQT